MQPDDPPCGHMHGRCVDHQGQSAAAHMLRQKSCQCPVSIKIYIFFSSYYRCCSSPSCTFAHFPKHRPRQNVVNIRVLMVQRTFYPFPIPQTQKSGVEHRRRCLAFLASKPPAFLLPHFKMNVHVRGDEFRGRQRGRRKGTRRRKVGGAIADRDGNKHARQVVIFNSEFCPVVSCVRLHDRQGAHACRIKPPERSLELLWLLLIHIFLSCLLLLLLPHLQQRCPGRPYGKDERAPPFVIPGRAHPVVVITHRRAVAAGAELYQVGKREEGEAGRNQVLRKEGRGGD